MAVYDDRRAKRYAGIKIWVAVLRLALTGAFLVLVLVSGVSEWLRDMVAVVGRNFYLQVGLYLAAFGCMYYLFLLWLDFYSGFVLEKKFLLSNETALGWFKRRIKKFFLSLFIFVVMGEGLYFFIRTFPADWWIFVAVVWLVFTLLLGWILPVLIIPLFYRCSSLKNEGLKQRLLRLAQKCGVNVKDVYEINISKETKKANAAVAGWGRNRRILLGDTLLENHTDQEIEAIFAHELAHICLFHMWKATCFAAVITSISFYFTCPLVDFAAGWFGYTGSDLAAFPILAMLLLVTGFLLMPAQLGFQRYLEKQADIFALKHIEQAQALASALKKLSRRNLADPAPSRLKELLFYDHPPISKRLSLIEDHQRR